MPKLSEAENKFFESGGEDNSALHAENPTIAPKDVPQETSVNKHDEGTQLTLVPTDETPEQKQAREAKATEESAKAEREKKRKEAIEGLGLVPLEALQEARNEGKITKRELDELKAWKQQVEPTLKLLTPAADAITNPYPPGTEQHILWEAATPEQKKSAWEWEAQKREVAELKQARERDTKTQEATQRTQQILGWADTQRQAFEKTTPDFKDAMDFAIESRTNELKAIGMNEMEVSQAVENSKAELIMLAANRTIQGIPTNPAQLIYEFAKARGYKGKAAVEDKSAATVAKIKAGQAAAGGLNGGGSTPKGEISIEEINRMPTRTVKQREAYNQAWDSYWQTH